MSSARVIRGALEPRDARARSLVAALRNRLDELVSDCVVLYFSEGNKLANSSNLMLDAGETMRYVPIRNETDSRAPVVGALTRRATALSKR